ncbi:hypothetical protein MUA01_19260 [Enterobacteriaceae bacterium H18W14]|uniref:hypothetical protein n=1 Tax=Dryocola boscaweniae TaxID=2925397 RepID=UPI0022F0F933|nr:hypothetical protein [Dryocola boscaweniae]MCT4717094.1 hypothetical protein [Dryocola boscaweniae]
MHITFILKRLFLIILCALAVASGVLILFSDVIWFHDFVRENSFTEIVQESILLLLALLFFGHAKKVPSRRHSSVLIGGFFTCMLIRELDFAFDQIFHGSWVWFALFTTFACVSYALRNKPKALEGLAAFMRHPAYGMMLAGLLCVMVFSRLFGMHELWEGLMLDGYNRLVKNMVEEGTEMFGYIICLLSGIWYLCHRPER